MEQNLQTILDLIKADANLSEDEKMAIISGLNAADKKMNIEAFKFERSENVKRTMSVLLEETIEELEQKRKAVEDKNRDLEIEASLERVRTVAMGMQKPDELLGICETLFNELVRLRFVMIRNSQIFIYNDAKASFTNYGFSEFEGAAIAEIAYDSHPKVNAFITAVRKTSDAFAELAISGDELKAWRSYRVDNGEPDDERLENIGTLYYYFYSIGIGAIGISNFESISAEQLAILKRFRNVFDLAYRRYADLEQALAQAKEALLEASLEKVRAQALGMRKPEELLDICEALFAELQNLGFTEIRNAMINVFDDDKSSFLNYDYSPDAGQTITHHFYDGHPVIEKMVSESRSAADAFSETVFAGKDLDDWKAFRRKKGEKDDPRVDNVTALYYYFYSVGTAAIGVSTFSPIDEEKRNVLKRFRNVFDFAYRRYTDVSQAEAQAEAQIELGLERVRARAMAMQSSNELADLVTTLFHELSKLDFALSWCIINIIDGNSLSNTVWAKNADADGAPESFHMKFEGYPFHDAMWDAWKAKKAKYVYTLGGDEKKVYDEYLLNETEFKRLSAAVKGSIRAAKQLVCSFTFSNFGGLQTVGDESLSDASLDILSRFGKVFDLTYTRFNDLKLAEEQAREARIEAAVEKVRSRSLAMHKSNELHEVVRVVAEKLRELGIEMEGAVICIPAENKKGLRMWSAMAAHMDVPSFYVPYGHPLIAAFAETWEKGIEFLAESWSFEEKNEYWKWAFENSDFKYLPESRKNQILGGSAYALSTAFSKNSAITIPSHTGQMLSDEDGEILKRFSRVFDQAYIRFNDLKKAEEQAREAQIELGLERVRARAMAMQSSGELADLVTTLFSELSKLHITFTRCMIWLMESDTSAATVWMADPVADKAFSSRMQFLDLAYHKAFIKAWKERKQQWAYELKGEEKQVLNELVFSMPGTANTPEEVKAAMIAAERVTLSFSFSNFGGLQVDGPESLSEDNLDILSRFSKVFDQTYTRFNDLKQAEEQAREAKIEAALERVRSRTMAMHQSNELAETVSVLFKQLLGLGIRPEQIRTCGIVTFDAKEPMGETWITETNGDINPVAFKSRYDEAPAYKKIYSAWKKGEKFEVLHLESQKLKEHLGYVVKYTPTHVRDINSPELPTEIWYHVLFFSQGYLFVITREALPEYYDVFKRFGAVLQQSYTRFLDLKKAEAQAREGQIELALERVRARTMAMQKSDELPEAANLLFQQVQELGMPAWSAGYVIWDEDKKACTLYMSSEGVLQPPFKAPLTEELSFIHFLEAWQRGQTFHVEEIGGEALVEHYKYLRTLPGISEMLDKIADAGFPVPTFQIFHSVYFSQGFLLFITYEPVPAAWDIFKRFGKVFDQTYTRFLDLKKAEAQAREALIEGALERVRSRAMAMHKTDELMNAAELLYKELVGLGISSLSVCYVLVNEEDKTSLYYGINPVDGKIMSPPVSMPHTETKVMRALRSSWLKQETVNFIELDPKASLEHQTYIGNLIAAAFKAAGTAEGFTVEGFLSVSPERIHIYSLNFKQGYLFLVGGAPLAAAEIDILTRFTKVFELTYTRFLDLQKAEAQTREAQIELSLERVRANAMAMHHSDELSQVLSILFEQFDVLDIRPVDAHLDLFDLEKNTFSYRATGKEGTRVIAEQIVDLNSRPEWQSLAQRWKQGKPQTVDFSYYPKEVVRDLMAFFPDIWAAMPAESIMNPEVDFPDGIYDALGYCKFGYLGFHHNRKTTEEENRILIRFTNEFERLYQRFLDLQKAEAQTRESKIELALERVRARTMAMQHSDELAETAYILFQQFRDLGENPDQATIGIINEAEGVIEYWVTIHGSQTNRVYKFPVDEPNVTHKIYKAWKKHEKSLVIDLSGKELYDFSKFRESMGGAGYNPDEKRRIINVAFFSKGLINVQSTVERSVESLRLLERFANVFEGTYTRFLDLKNAEAQARESQIQLAIERVRAKTMAMQRSDELADAASLLFKQISDFGIRVWTSAFQIWNADDISTTAWASAPDGSIQAPFRLPYNEDIFFKRIYEARQSGKDFFVMESSGKELEDTYHYMFNLPGVKKYFDDAQDLGFPIPKYQITHCAFFSNGYLMLITYEPCPEMWDIFKRFGNVFEQTYTRFLDLQKAEAQARESQIQLGLERVRARTMAMQRSGELGDVATILFKELNQLVENLWTCGFVLCEKDRTEDEWWLCTETGFIPAFYLPNIGDATHANIYNAWKNGESFHVEQLEDEALDDHYAWLRTIPACKAIFDEMIASGFPLPRWQKLHCAYFSSGYLVMITQVPCPEEEIFKRFAQAFDQTYTRFLDLQRAEAQARESQIQLALERVRARTMAMQKSDELAETVSLLFKQLIGLGIRTEQIRTCGIVTFDDDEPVGEQWVTETTGEIIPQSFRVSYNESPAYISIYESWKKGEKFKVIHLQGESLKQHFRYLDKHAIVPTRDMVARRQAKEIYHHELFFSQGYLFIITSEALPEFHDVFKRFGAVFQQSYTRFLDLKKAEAQAREAEIELGLERVRARTMAMQKSDELIEASDVLFKELTKLGIETIRTGVGIFDPVTRSVEIWSRSEGNNRTENKILGTVPEGIHRVFDMMIKADRKKQSYCVEETVGEEVKDYYKKLAPYLSYPKRKKYNKRETFTAFLFPEGSLNVISEERLNDEQCRIMVRFARVFGLIYRRFLDLQNAEAQARESQIQLALERVRARTMAMQHSGELPETANLLFKQVQELGMPAWSAGYCNWTDNKNAITFWMSSEGVLQPPFSMPTTQDPSCIHMREAAERGETFYVEEVGGEALVKHYEYMHTLPVVGEVLDSIINAGHPLPSFQIFHLAYFTHGFLLFISYEPVPAAHDIFKRFAAVFEQTYTRFLDLQRAEEQAREAKIEAALERVRAVAMSMRKPEELLEISQTIFTQLKALDFADVRNTEIIINSDEKESVMSYYYSDYGVTGIIEVFFNEHPTVKAWANEMRKANDAFAGMVITEDEIAAWRKYREEIGYQPDPKLDEAKEVFYYSYSIGLGGLSISTFTPISDDQKKILERFRNVFNLSYQRYADIARAEEQAREAIKQASLDRVRAEIASMRTTTDLERITPLVWNELTILGIPFIRCGVFIVDEQAELIHTHLSTPDGRALAAFDLQFDSEGIGQNVLPAWRKKQMATIHWSEEEYAAYTKNLVARGTVKSEERIVTEHPDTSLDLHFFPFLQGMLYAGNTAPLTDDEKDLVQSLADAFSTAYARYEDFNKLEAAKQQVDKTLTDLKAAQTQLIQTEKMASLGELTAGIAHEIQNPLNFVNNFSEVNAELIEEMKEEIEKGDLKEIKALALDIEENSKRINLHGKRADGIVKGMLQHSKSASGVKEPTNINSVADEYMRLAYHGLRAKDKGFNAEMVTHFDPELPKLNVIGQDIGRVMLNLFNNAFYAVNKKQKTAGDGYKPEVTVTTYVENGQVIIKVKDNGVGIPDAIKEKIMQPFFTTKPTGEGTGLGLSLTYDMVVKGHGGSIQVNSVEGEGSEFIIKLPVG